MELLADLDDIKEHAKYCRYVLYRIDEAKDGFRVRVKAGSYGFDGIVKKEDLDSILLWLEQIDAKMVKGSISDDVFFV
jgi:hypothetical protein